MKKVIPNKKIEAVINIVESIKDIIKAPDTDMLHSGFGTPEDLNKELDKHIQKLSKEDFSKLDDLIILFAPTSDLQEISVDSGWGNLYIKLSEKFDIAINNLIEEYNLKPFSKR